MNPQGNPGSFMSQGAGQPQNQGSALMRLMQLRQMGASPQAGNNVPLPAAPVQTGSPINMNSMNQAGGGGQPMPQTPNMQQPQPGMNPQASLNPDDQHLDLALNALASYVKSHGSALEAKHNVPLKKAQASAMATQQNPPSSGVGA